MQIGSQAAKQLGFTLAEVLITLGIIGVVSALTIPALISKYEKNIIEAGLAKTYSELQSVIRMAEEEHGSFATWDFSIGTKNFVNKYFAPYMELSSCGRNYYNVEGKCFVTNGNWLSWYLPTETSKRGEKQDTNSMYIGYLLNDGRALIFYSEYYGGNVPRLTLTIFADVNGKRGRTVMGQDVFAFSINNLRGITNRLKVGPGASWSEDKSSEYLTENCIKTIPYVIWKGSACGHLLERNGWKFPKNYPIKF